MLDERKLSLRSRSSVLYRRRDVEWQNTSGIYDCVSPVAMLKLWRSEDQLSSNTVSAVEARALLPLRARRREFT